MKILYTNDFLGRRTSKNNEQYGYNVRDELISADEVAYNYDDIGNRTTAEDTTYTANNLNQYTAIDDFSPQYDADGNQTLIKTETGIWSVVYNAENRPVRWQSGDTVITMSFDRMGRRVEMRMVKESTETLQRFVYNNYLCIQQLHGTDNTLFRSYVWDPTEPIATRPLIFLPSSGETAYYFHDGNKNVVDLIPISGTSIHYDYAPFGTATASASSDNPFRFSSEVYDDSFGLVYYNYRHYHSQDGRWARRDPQEEMERFGAYGFVRNCPVSLFDFVGLDIIDNIINELKQNENTLKDFVVYFYFAADRPSGNKFSTKNVEERLRKAITDLFPKAKISIQEKENFNAPDVIGALNAPECVCGFFYIGYVGINDGRPRIIFDRNRTSIGSHISAGQETPDRHKLDEISGKNFSKSAVSGIIGYNSAVSSSIGGGCSSHTISSFAQTFAQHTGASTWGSTTGVNFNPDGQVTRGGFWDSEENGRSFK